MVHTERAVTFPGRNFRSAATHAATHTATHAATHTATHAVPHRAGHRTYRLTRLVRLLVCLFPLFFAFHTAHAAGPRWTAANPPWRNYGQPMAWYRTDVHYYVDNGPLSTYVSNSAAQGIISAAASVWNIPYSTFSIAQGGSLNEDVSANNVYLGSSGPIWPADVQSANYLNKQIAIVLDADGTITDMLLGSGASSPFNCRQNAVTETVDLFIQPGSIAHAVVVLNGRCTGPAPEQQLQIQYQLMRVFGRVIGLGWSQVNDNVFTGAPQPTYQQQMHWPIMHPIDIVCGTYTYQCLPSPFTLRDDDRTSVRMLYDVSAYSYTDGQFLAGYLYFPTGQGMSGVNMVTRRQSFYSTYGGTESWETNSSVTGATFRKSNGNPVTGPVTGFPAMQGDTGRNFEASWVLPTVPVIDGTPWDNVLVTMQPINPLYVGQYAVGPFAGAPVAPSGSAQTITFSVVGRTGVNVTSTYVGDAASDCSTGNDGTETAPAPVAPGGLWSGRLCGEGHSSWGSVNVQAGRSATLEAMALDENGNATAEKARPLLGIWHGSDPTGVTPTLAAATSAFNGRQNGTTQLNASFSASETVRFTITDERGLGRPDFTYAARLLYADSVSPARMTSAGGAVRILGCGFEPGNTVTIGGISATVTGVSPTEIDAVAPSLAALAGQTNNDVTVTDLRTGGTTTITGGLIYGSATGDVLLLVQAPSGNQFTGVPQTFGVRLVNSSGNPVLNGTVHFAVLSGAAAFSACGLNACDITTDAGGNALARVTATAPGVIAVQASIAGGSTVNAQFTAVAVAQTVSALRSPEYIVAGPGASITPAAVLVSNGSRASAVPVAWTSSTSEIALGSSGALSLSDGTVQVSAVTALTAGESAFLQACAWNAICGTLPLVGVDPATLSIAAVSGDTQVVSSGSSLGPLVLRVIDPRGHGVAGAVVQVHQSVSAWQPACPVGGRCAVAPVYGTGSTGITSDDDGLLLIEPMQYAGTAALTRVVAAVGSNGYLAATLSKQP